MASGNISLKSSRAWKGNIYWESTSHVSGNYSDLHVTATMWKTDGYLTSSDSPTSGTITIDGDTYSLDGIKEFKNEVTIFDETVTVYHNSDGSKSVSISLSCKGQGNTSLSGVTLSGSGTAVLDRIATSIALTSATNFTDEGNPVINYSNPAGTGADSLKVAILSEDGSKEYVAYRDLDRTSSKCTLNLSDTERNALRNASPNSNTLKVKFSLVATFGSTTLKDEIVKQCTIINANPTLTATVTEKNTSVADLTGSSGKMIRYISNAAVSMTVSAKKGASISKQTITCGSKTISGTSGTFSGIESGEFVFTVTDSRGNRTSQTVTKEIVDYIIPSINIGADVPSTDGSFTFSVSGNFFNGSFGSVSNSLTVQYRYKTGTGSYSSWTTLTVTKSGNTYKASKNFTGLDYQTTYTFQARVTDKLKTVTTEEKPMRSTPVFDWGKDDMSINVDLNVNAYTIIDDDLDVHGDLYLSSELYMKGNPYCPYKAGDIYITMSDVSPASRFGGTWEKIEGRVLLGASSSYKAGSTGGEATVTLTEETIAKHRHYGVRRNTAEEADSGSHSTGASAGDGGVLPYTNYAGGGKPHNNMMPYMAVYIWRRVS